MMCKPRTPEQIILEAAETIEYAEIAHKAGVLDPKVLEALIGMHADLAMELVKVEDRAAVLYASHEMRFQMRELELEATELLQAIAESETQDGRQANR